MSIESLIHTRPINLLDSNSRPIYDSVDYLTFRGEYSGSNLIYAGFARVGSPEGEDVWQIFQLNYDGTNLISILWPENDMGRPSMEYQFAWADRASYTYS